MDDLVGEEYAAYVWAMRNSIIWTEEHVDFLANLDHQHLTNQQLSVLMSKHFKFRVTADHVNRLLGKMRMRSHEFYRNIPYRTSARQY